MMLSRILVLLAVMTLVACGSMGETRVVKAPDEADLKQAAALNVELGVGYIKRQQYKAARDKLEKATQQDPSNVEAFKTLAYLYAILGLNDEAQARYESALAISPNDSALLNSYGAFLCSIGKLDEAQERFKQAYSDPFYESRYLAESNAGSCYIKQGEYVKAEALLRKSLRVDPRLPGSLLSMADVGVKTKKFLMARAYIQRYHDVRKPSAESLWIQVQAENSLGAKDHYMKYARQLINDFPDSDEAGWAEAQARDKQFR